MDKETIKWALKVLFWALVMVAGFVSVLYFLVGFPLVWSIIITGILLLLILLADKSTRPAPPLKMNESCWNDPDDD